MLKLCARELVFGEFEPNEFLIFREICEGLKVCLVHAEAVKTCVSGKVFTISFRESFNFELVQNKIVIL